MKYLTIPTLCIGLLFCDEVLAENERIYVGGGHAYTLGCNNDGYILTSERKIPSVEFGDSGADWGFKSRTETYFLGRSCDAIFQRGDTTQTGTWCQGNGGFVVNAGRGPSFIKQGLFCELPDVDAALSNCDCGQ